jgi:hypothetical protein
MSLLREAGETRTGPIGHHAVRREKRVSDDEEDANKRRAAQSKAFPIPH